MPAQYFYKQRSFTSWSIVKTNNNISSVFVIYVIYGPYIWFMVVKFILAKRRIDKHSFIEQIFFKRESDVVLFTIIKIIFIACRVLCKFYKNKTNKK